MRLVKRDLKVRYKASVLGYLWSVAKPLLLVVIYTIVFDKFLAIPLNPEAPPGEALPYSAHIMTGLLAWIFFTGAVGESMHVILANGNLIKKVRLPHEVFPVAAVLSNLAHFLLALPVLFAFMGWKGIDLTWQALWLVPLVGLQTMLAVAFALALSALNVFYRDISSAFEAIFTAWLYATPIIYPVGIPARHMGLGGAAGPFDSLLFNLYMLNPMAPIVLAYRRVLLYAAPFGPGAESPPPLEYAAFAGTHPDQWLLIQLGLCALLALALLWIGSRIFSHYSPRFADEL